MAEHIRHIVTQSESIRFTFPWQREGRRLCISDFFAPKSSDKMDVIGFSLVTMGAKASQETQRLFEGGEYTRYLYLHGLSVRSEEHTSELQSLRHLVCRLLLEKKNTITERRHVD